MNEKLQAEVEEAIEKFGRAVLSGKEVLVPYERVKQRLEELEEKAWQYDDLCR